jgi:prophage regulatory protein
MIIILEKMTAKKPRSITIPPTGFIGEPQVEALTNLNRSTLRRMWASGQFPAPIRLSEKRIGFAVEEVLRWLDEKRANARVVDLPSTKLCTPTVLSMATAA